MSKSLLPVMAGLAVVAFAALIAACGSPSQVSREIGARCQSNDDCAALCLSGAEYPDGFCSQNCDDSSDCALGAVCVDVDQGICLLPCESPRDCAFLGAGWTCAMRPGRPQAEVSVCIGQ